MTDTCIHRNLSAICPECADPLDVTGELAYAMWPGDARDPVYAKECRDDAVAVIGRLRARGIYVVRDPATVPGWTGGLPLILAAIVLGIVIGRITA